jgi:septal ring factor EnvC (AmiA/AmiB activator)
VTAALRRPPTVALLRAIVIALACALAAPSAIAQVTSAKSHTSTKKKSKTRSTKSLKAATKPKDSAPPIDVSNPREAQLTQTAERDRLTARIAELKQQIAVGERWRSGATVALKRAERALAEVNHRLDELARRQHESQERIAGLDRQRAGTESQTAARQAAFGRTATMLYANQDRDPVRAFLAGGDPGEPRMTDVYLGYIARAEAADIDALHGRARELQSQRQRADEDNRALMAQTEEQRSAREALAASQAAQQKSLAQLSQQLAEQRNTAAALAADEQRLTRVVEQLQRVLERQAAEERAKREAAKRLAEQQAAKKSRSASNSTPRTREEAPPTRIEAVPDETSGGGAFAQLRGQLRLPVRGALVGRFGAPRGTSGATWKGVFVRTDNGADVHAVAAGKIVFADDLRGFGNLVIIDHGDQYLSIYGNNESLLKRTGELVKPGDVISRAGNSSGDDQTGLYFELRFRGKPFDPMSWAGAR